MCNVRPPKVYTFDINIPVFVHSSVLSEGKGAIIDVLYNADKFTIKTLHDSSVVSKGLLNPPIFGRMPGGGRAGVSVSNDGTLRYACRY